MGLMCIPDINKMVNATADVLNAVGSLGSIGTVNTWIHDLEVVWPILIATLFISLVISILNLYLVNLFVAVVIWGSVVALTIALVVAGIVCWHQYASGEAL